MKQLHGLENLVRPLRKPLSASQLAQALLNDLQQSECVIYGCIDEDSEIELARLKLVPDTLNYEMFDQRIDLSVAGLILRNDCVPLTYRLAGKVFGITGRCSMIGRVCGVDLYLHASYTGVVGDLARKRFAIALPALVKRSNGL